MSSLENILGHFEQHSLFTLALPNLSSEPIQIVGSLTKPITLLWCGNIGSPADDQHLAVEFVDQLKKDRKALRSITLTTDTLIKTCFANEDTYEDVFSWQLEASAREGYLNEKELGLA